MIWFLGLSAAALIVIIALFWGTFFGIGDYIFCVIMWLFIVGVLIVVGTASSTNAGNTSKKYNNDRYQVTVTTNYRYWYGDKHYKFKNDKRIVIYDSKKKEVVRNEEIN